MANKNSVEIEEIVFLVDGKRVRVEIDKITTFCDSWDCDICGSHGTITLSFTDDSEKFKQVILDEW